MKGEQLMAADSGTVRGGLAERGGAMGAFQQQIGAGQTTGIPVRSVQIRIEAFDGITAVPKGTTTISIPIPERLSLRVAKMHVLELALADLKRTLAEPLKAIGCK
jgi:hypothetical protein